MKAVDRLYEGLEMTPAATLRALERAERRRAIVGVAHRLMSQIRRLYLLNDQMKLARSVGIALDVLGDHLDQAEFVVDQLLSELGEDLAQVTEKEREAALAREWRDADREGTELALGILESAGARVKRTPAPPAGG